MKLSELIKALEKSKEQLGDIPVTIACEGKPESGDIGFMVWQNDDGTADRLMLCDHKAFLELASQ